MTARKIIGPWAAGLVVWGIMLWPPQASAQNTGEGLSLGLSVGGEYVFPSNPAHSSHPAGGGTLFLQFRSLIALEIEGLFAAVPTESQPLGFSQGHLYQVPVLLNFRLRVPLGKSPLALFLKAGGGYSFLNMKLDAEMVKTYSTLGFEVSESCQPAILFQAGGGLELRFSSHLAMEAFGLYRVSETSGTWSITDSLSGVQSSGTIENVSLEAAAAGLSLRFIF